MFIVSQTIGDTNTFINDNLIKHSTEKEAKNPTSDTNE